MPHEIEDGILTSRPGHTRSSSLAPSLTLPFLAGDTAGTEKAAGPPGALGWLSEDKHAKDNDSDDDGEDREERVRCKSPFGIENFASDDDERMDATAIWANDDEKEEARMREISYDPSKKPELQRMSVAASFAGVLEGFGIGGPAGGDGSDDEGDKENKRSTVQVRRLSVHNYKDGSDDSDDEDDEEERRPLSSILLGNDRKSQAFSPGRIPGKVALGPPRLDLPLDFAIATREESDSEAEDEAPLALKRLNASLTAGAQGRTYDDEDDVQQGNNEDSEEDDLPLAVKQNDDKPLGQAHPVAALTQQMELQQQQNMALMTHLQLQYQYAMQMQLQQAIIQQGKLTKVSMLWEYQPLMNLASSVQ